MRRAFPIFFFALLFAVSGCVFGPNNGNSGNTDDVGTDAGSDADTSGDVQDDTTPECSASETLCGGDCVDTTSSMDHCGSCDNACAPTDDNVATSCQASMCESTGDCAEDYVDLDGDDSNGCECEITDATDPPGDGDDTNCDGIDGNRSAALFVKEGATGDGLTADTPTGSLSDALSDVAGDAELTQVLVAQGSYPPFSLVSDVTIAGGYSGGFQAYDPSSYETVVERSADATGAGDVTTVDAQNVENTVVVSMRIIAADAVDPGASTVAVHAENSDFELRALTLEGGQAADGTDGEQVSGAVSCSPHAGGAGAQPDNFNPCDRPQETSATSGGTGDPSGSGGMGGSGGDHECAGSVQQPTCTSATDAGNADDGTPGSPGTDGATPDNGVGSIANGFWAPATGAAPAPGTKGAGGGGGGAGGNCGSDIAGFTTGGKGGDGGDGGCGGKAGNNGQPGGASILILSVGSDVTLTDVTGLPGTGGDGGAGSAGGAGESGGDGAGGGRVQTAGDGGNGGFGGNGGAGGDGAGGCGGPAFGVAFNSASTITGELDIPTGETFDAGQPGNGANDAPAGCDGVASSEQAL